MIRKINLRNFNILLGREKMKVTKRIIVVLLLIILCTTSSMGQRLDSRNIIKRFVQKDVAGEYILKTATLSVEDNIVSKTFKVDVRVSEEYYLDAWIMGANGKDGTHSLQVYFDGQKQPIGKIDVSETGWQFSKMLSSVGKPLEKGISFSSGTHTISFRCKAPEVPAVEFIHLSKQNSKVELSGLRYHNYVDSLKHSSLPKKYAQLNYKLMKGEIEPMILLYNPEGDYVYSLDINFNYTFYRFFYFTAGTNVIFETKKSNPC